MKKMLFLLALTLIIVSNLFAGSPDDLMSATRAGDLARVKTLIQQGVDVNTKDSIGITPLHWASFGGYFEVVKYLITMGADDQAKTEKIGIGIYAGSTARDIAVERDYPDIVKFLNGTN